MNTKKRFRDYGLSVGPLKTGSRNLITDVSGLKVGHVTYNEGDEIRTGLTVLDTGKDIFRNKMPAAIAVGNGYGKLAGYTQVAELGTLESPIALTNTLAVGPVVRGVVDAVIKQNPDLNPWETINAVVGETNDAWTNRIHRDIVKKEDVQTALDNATEDFQLGCVGAGTGTRAFSWKGGIGSSSRVVEVEGKTYTVGALVQTNYGGDLRINGKTVGWKLGKTDFDFMLPVDGSCIIVIATDAPMSPVHLKRMANRGVFALARTGSVMAHASGDYAIAFSTNRAGADGPQSGPTLVHETPVLTPFFLAAMDAVEEAVYDALFLADKTVGRDGETLEALPIDEIIDWLRE